MAVIPLTFRDLLCSLLLLLKVTVVLFWLGLSTPQDFIGSSLILSNLLLIDRLATPVDPRMDSNALLCLIFGGRVMQALCFFLLSIFSRSFYSLTVQFFQVLRSFSGLPLSLGYSVLSCLTAVAWTTIGLLVMIEACQASRPGAGRGGILHPRMLLRSARIATFCCFMVSLLFPCFFLVSLSLSLSRSLSSHFAVAVHHHPAAHALLVGDAQRLRCALDGAGAAGATASGRLGSLRRGIQALHDLPPWAALPSAEHLLDLRSALCVHSALG